MVSFQSPTAVPEVRLVALGATTALQQSVPVGNLRSQRIEQFLGTRNLASNTQRNYERQLRVFLDWVDKDWHMVTLNDLKNYKAHLEHQGLGLSTIGAYLTALKSFYTWMVKAGYMDKSPAAALEIPSTPEGEGKNLEAHMVRALFDALPEVGAAAARDRAILCLLIRVGLRAEEVSALDVGHYNGVEINVRRAKHQSVGLVPVDQETHEALLDYLTVRWMESQETLSSDAPLFVSYSPRNKGERLSYEGIYKLVKALAKRAGLEHIHPHRGRHTFIANMVENGVDAYLAMELSRQRSLKAYQTYSKKVRYQAAKTAFLKGKGEPERTPMNLEDLLRSRK
ncbi:MAG TPA: tyrosine-type recombinase/integrase [Stenomitos sp.]